MMLNSDWFHDSEYLRQAVKLEAAAAPLPKQCDQLAIGVNRIIGAIVRHEHDSRLSSELATSI